jgi:uncharacterized protein YecE (DUF72 family)
MPLFVGTSGFAYPKWKGSFYPEKLPAKQFLRYYAEHFRSVEINNTFYKLPTTAALEAWAAEVPADFRFPLKAPQLITHIKRLKDVAEPVAAFVAVAAALKERLGPLLFQLPPNMKKAVPRLTAVLELVPASFRVAWEFRHPSWFDDDVYTALREHQAALCVAEADDDLEVPLVATAGWGYLRLRREKYTAPALKKWVTRVREQAWADTFVFFKHEDTGTGPRFAKDFLRHAEPPEPGR